METMTVVDAEEKAPRAVRPAIKKLPPELRKPKPQWRGERHTGKRLLLRLKEDSQVLRSIVQGCFVLLCLWIGVEFHFFVQAGLAQGAVDASRRPPGVEGFLPISALMSLRFWALTGTINGIHPSGLFILLAVVAISLLVKKAFCSWLCPVGTLSEGLWMLGRRMFGRTFALPRWLDFPLRGLKYLLLGFFSYSILTMDLDGLAAFLYSPYNRMADVKMYLFFAELEGVALASILALLVFSVFVQNFWCRYLCPYGALLGLVGLLSPIAVRRRVSTCIDCSLCTKACPARIPVHTVRRVWSDECSSCMACVEACPVRDTLELRSHSRGRAIPGWVIGSVVAAVFVVVTGTAILAGHWHNTVTSAEYQKRFKEIHSPLYQHARGQVPHYGPND